MSESNNKRILNNTLLLYSRMLLTMVIALFTVRVVLETLGVIDYGIYNVVGSVVAVMAVLTNTMASASQRFFAFEIGQNNYVKLKKTFSASISIYTGLALIVLIFAETCGLWFLNNKVNIPLERLSAANWVYQFSIISFVLGMFVVPYNALILAHEKMKFFAYVSILEVVLKLVVVYLLVLMPYDKLKLYAALIFLITFLVSCVYISFCNRRFQESKISWHWDSKLIKEIAGYSGWSLFGATTGVLNNQGLNVLLNLFYGPLINTARGIAFQVNNAVSLFVNNLFSAVNPQIIKAYAEGDLERQAKLVIYSTKVAYTLLLILSLPILINTQYILKLWLGKGIDTNMILFTRLALVYSLVNVFESPITQVVRSTGKIKKYQLYVGILTLLILPISYLAIKLGAGPESSFYVMIIIYIIAMFVRLYVLNSLVDFPIRSYLINVFFKIIVMSAVVSIVPLFIDTLFSSDSLSRFVCVAISTFISIIIVFFYSMLNTYERDMVKEYVMVFAKRIKK